MTIEYGLSATGFRRKRLDEQLDELKASIVALMGPVNTGADAVLGQILGTFADAMSTSWQELEDTYYSQYPATAEGTSLDNAVDLIGIVRLPGTKTEVQVLATGNEGVEVPAGSIIKAPDTDDLFENELPGIITQSAALAATINVTTVSAAVNYTVNLNGNNYTFMSDPSPTAENIAEGLVDAINATTDPVTATELTGGQFKLESDDPEITFNVSVADRLAVLTRSSPITFLAQEAGDILALANTLTAIVTPVSGWQSVNNPLDGATGRHRETDAELRIRRLSSLRILGAASVPAIEARLRQDVPGVTSAYVFENKTATTDGNGRPPHSFEAVVEGGDDQAIAQKIWDIKAAGIQTYGNETEIVIDSNGFEQEIKFSRPTPVYVWIDVELTLLPSTTIPDSVLEDIQEALFTHGLTFGVGQDVLYQTFFSPIYAIALQYISSVAITFATSAVEEGPPGSYTAANVTIDEVEISSFNVDRIVVAEA